jgi:hypothetical protein
VAGVIDGAVVRAEGGILPEWLIAALRRVLASRDPARNTS